MTSSMALFQNTKNGQIVDFIGYHDRDYAMVKNNAGVVNYVPLSDLVPYEPGKGRVGDSPAPQSAEIKPDEDLLPPTAIPVDTRVNVNVATAEGLASGVKGIGYATAKKIIEKRMSLPGERFQNLDQLRSVPRVDWDTVIGEDLIFVG